MLKLQFLCDMVQKATRRPMSTQFMRNSTKTTEAGEGAARTARSFDAAEVLERVRVVFLEKGFSGASLDDLAAAAELNRPSLYAAFGDKEGLYHATLRASTASRASQVTGIRSSRVSWPIQQRLGQVYKAAVDALYDDAERAGLHDRQHRRCRGADPSEDWRRGGQLIAELEAVLERAFARAVSEGELTPLPSPATRARLAAGCSTRLRCVRGLARAQTTSESSRFQWCRAFAPGRLALPRGKVVPPPIDGTLKIWPATIKMRIPRQSG